MKKCLKRLALATSVLFLASVGSTGCSLEKESSTTKKPVIETLITTTGSWNGDLFSYPEGQAEMTLERITAPVGFRTSVHIHSQPGVAYVAKGRIECVVTANKTIQIGQDESFATSQNTPHYCESIGDEAAVIFVAYAGVKGQPVTLQQK